MYHVYMANVYVKKGYKTLRNISVKFFDKAEVVRTSDTKMSYHKSSSHYIIHTNT